MSGVASMVVDAEKLLGPDFVRLAAHVTDAVAILDRSSTICYHNLDGRLPVRLTGMRVADFLVPDERDDFLTTLARVADSGTAEVIQYRTVMGETWESLVARVPGPGSSHYLYSVARRLEDTAFRDEAIRSMLKAAVESTGMGLISWNLEDDEVMLDARGREILGAGTEEVQSRESFLGHIHGDDRARAQKELLGGEALVGQSEFRCATASPEQRWVSLSGHRSRRPDGTIFVFTGALFDITDRHRLQEQLLHSQKLEAVGQLTAGIAHNFNNILSAILPSLKLLAPHLDAKGAKYAHIAEVAAERASILVAELMVVAGRKSTEHKEPVDVAEIVRRVGRICQTTFGGWITLRVEVDTPSPCVVIGNEGQLEQVLLNLLLNARDAFEEARTSAPSLDVSVERADQQILVRVVDNGPGMSSETLQRIFEPFFTTKATGTGLGLATAYAIIGEHGGTIDCQSHPRNGTRFELRLPASASPVVARPAAKNKRSTRGDETILLVDDDDLVRASMALILMETGYSVVEAASGEVALELFGDGSRYGAVISDMAMPHLTGLQLLTALRKRRPDIPCVLMSGVIDEQADVPADIEQMQKPVAIDDLLASLRRAIDQG